MAMLWLLRHGARLDHYDPGWRARSSTRWDPPISPQGEAQAVAVADFFAARPVRRIYASPYLRTLQTAQATARRLRLPIAIEHGIIEPLKPGNCHPELEALPSSADRRALIPEVDLAYRSRGGFFFPEKPSDTAERMRRICELLGEEADGDLVCFTHGGAIGCLIRELFPDELAERGTDTAVIHGLRLDAPGWRYEIQAERGHLPPELGAICY